MSSFSIKGNASDTEYTPHPDEKNKQWQREFLMERLRSHYAQHKSFPELSKAMRMSMLEKRYALDAVEKSNLQKCLDNMQHCIKITTRAGLIERLDSLSRQLGLKFMEDPAGLFIYSDMFFLEIILDPNDGKLKDVKVHHECKIEQQSCSELVNCLINGDFADFTNQLEGLSSIYQLNAEPKVKSKAFVALQAMEMDLYNLFKWKSFNKDISSSLLDSPVGLVQKRRGGHPMKLTFFMSPYDLINLETKSITPLTMEYLKGKDIGMSVTVNLEASSANKLQILSTVTFSKENIPIYSPLNQNNSTLLPATFVLKLNKPLPVCEAILSTIGITPSKSDGTAQHLMNLTIQVASKGTIQGTGKGLFVTLPDQNHCYYFTENKKLTGSVITNVPYTEPSQVPKIITALKQQAIFFYLLSSCIRTGEKSFNLESTTILEVNALSIHEISVGLQHPYDESMVSVEFDLSDIGNIEVKIFSLCNGYEAVSRKLSKIVQMSLSIPITVRYLLKLWNHEQIKGFNRNQQENGNYDSNSLGGVGPSIDHLNGQLSRGPASVGTPTNLIGTEFQTNKINRNGNGNTMVCENNSVFAQGQGPRQPFYHGVNPGTNINIVSGDLVGNPMTSGISGNITNNINMNNVTSGLVNQFNLKAENLKNPLTQEDFCESPKSEKQSKIGTETGELKLYKLNKDAQNFQFSSSDNSLGGNDSQNTSKVTVTKSSLSGSSLTIEKIHTAGNSTISSSNTNGNGNSTNNGSNKNLDKTQSTEVTWKKPNSNDNKNTVSITPVITNPSTSDHSNVSSNAGIGKCSHSNSGNSNNSKSDKKSVIEIIPIKNTSNTAVSNSISITPIQTKNLPEINETSKSLFHTLTGSGSSSGSSSSSSSSKKKVDDRDSNKIEKKRRKKDNSSSSHTNNSKTFDNIELKIIEITGDGNTSTYTRKVTDSSKSSSNNFQKKQSSSQSSSSGSSSKSKASSSKSYSNSSSIPSSSKSPLSFSSSSSSPKNKHNLTSGKPSLTTLKSATNSYASTADTKESFSLIKLNQSSDTAQSNPYDIFQDEENDVFDFSTSSDYTSSLPSPQSKMRKSSLTAVIDKLNKQAKNSVNDEIGEKLERMHKDSQLSATSHITIDEISSKSNPEYMIKPSLDGMKLTINKTKTDSLSYKREKPSDSPKSGSSSPVVKKHFGLFSGGSNSNPGSCSPKKHTGLKPGVSSGPASKKPTPSFSDKPSSQNLKSRNFNLSKSNSSDCLAQKSSSLSSSVSKPHALSKSLSSNSLSDSSGGSGANRKDKSYSSKNKLSGNSGSSISSRSGNEAQDSASIKLLQFSSNKNIMEGFIKSLDTNFQIPKLSQKITVTPTTATATSTSQSTIAKSDTTSGNSSLNTNTVVDNSSKRNGQEPLKTLPNHVSKHLSAANVTLQKIDDSKLLKYNPNEKKVNHDKKIDISTMGVNNMSPGLLKDTKGSQKTHQKTSFSEVFANSVKNSIGMPSTAQLPTSSSASCSAAISSINPLYTTAAKGSTTTSSTHFSKINQQNFPSSSTPPQITSSVSVRLLKSPVPSPIQTTTTTAPSIVSSASGTNSVCLPVEDEIMEEGLGVRVTTK